jgi:hypothetical protein
MRVCVCVCARACAYARAYTRNPHKPNHGARNNLNKSQQRIKKEEQNSVIAFGCMVYLISSYASALENKTSYLHFKGGCS